MKKFTSFFCALMLIAMSANAMGNDARSIELKHRQTVMREAMIRNNGQLPIRVKAPQAKQEIFNLTIADKPSVSGYDYGTPQVYISMTSEENYGITIYINGIMEMENGKQYTYADMDQWSSIGNYNTYQYSGLSDAAITWSKDAEGLERFEGFVSDTLGNTYNFLYQEKAFAPTGDTIAVSFSKVGSFDHYSWSSSWTISGYDLYGSGNPYSVYFDLNIANDSTPVGHFTEADFADGTNGINVSFEGKPSKSYKFLSADINIIERNDSLLLNAYAMAEDGNVYDIYIYYSDPKPLHHENITAAMRVDLSSLSWGSLSFKSFNDDYEISIQVWGNSEEDYHKTYTYSDCYPSIYNRKDSTYVSFFSGEITITQGEEGDILSGSFLSWDNTEYELHLTEGLPNKTREEILSMDNAGLYQYEDPNKFIFWACNADSSRVVSISVLSDSIDGTYSIEHIELSNTYIAYNWNEMGYVTDIFRALDAQLTVSTDPESGLIILTGSILAQSDYHVSDVPEFILHLQAQPTHPHIEFDNDDADFEAIYAAYEVTEIKEIENERGYVIVTAENESSVAALAFFLAEGATSFAAGTYTCSLGSEPMTVYTGSCDGEYVYVSYFMDFNYNIWFPYAGTATVNEEGVIVFDAMNSYDRTINVTLYPKKEQGIENMEKDATNLNKRLENGVMIIEKNGVKYNVIGNVIK